MKLKFLAVGLFSVAIVTSGLVGCKPKGPPPPTGVEVQGVKVETQKLDQAFVGAPEELLAQKNEAIQNIRYGLTEKAFESLDKLINNPALNDAQKAAVNTVIEQMKAVATKTGGK